jgi:limonene-1,2-epoxide hydrolase
MSAEDIVRAELGAWSSLDIENFMAHFARDAVWDDPSHGPISGYEEIRNAVEGAVRRMTHADLEILNLVATDNVVMTEHVDRFIFDGKRAMPRSWASSRWSKTRTSRGVITSIWHRTKRADFACRCYACIPRNADVQGFWPCSLLGGQ